MPSLRRTCGNAGSIWVILGAVLYGCAFLLPAAGGAATITVDIIKPDHAPLVLDAGKQYQFEAVAFVEGEELPGGEVSWEWDFGDDSEHVLTNPVTHTFARCGNFVITVTARYGTLTGQDTINATAATAGLLDSVEFLVLPNTGGRVCDGVEVMLRIPEQELERHNAILGPVSFCRGPLWHPEPYTMDQQSRYMDGTAYRTVSVWWNTPGDPNTAAVDWRVDYTLWVLEPPPEGEEAPYYATVLDSKANSWTPYNLVITAGGPLVIEHHKGDGSHTLSWQAAHLEDDEGVIPKTYTAAVQVLDMSGNLVVSSPWLPYTINQPAAWDWEPGVPPEGDADGLYTFRVIADHSPEDSDCDKVDMLSEVGRPTPGDEIHIDWDTLTLKGKMKYTAAAELASPVLHIYGPSEAEISLPADAGYHEVSYELPIGYGTFWGVITADQTAVQAANNRDGIAKPAIPEGCYFGSIPGPPQEVEIYEPHHPPASNFNFCFSPDLLGGICRVVAKGRVVSYEQLNGGLHWEIDDVPGSILTMTPDPPKGPDIQCQYTGLPLFNSAFGPKTLILTHPLVQTPDEVEIRVFYCPEAVNHPTAAGDPLLPPPWFRPTANWFFYWRQGVVPDLANFTYNPFLDMGGYFEEFDILAVGPGARGSNGPSWEAVNQFDPTISYTVSAEGKGSQCCAEVCAHELMHQRLRSEASGYDTDGDGLSDAYELASPYHLNPFHSDTYQMGTRFPNKPEYAREGDKEFLCHLAERSPGSVNVDADWSNGGVHGIANDPQ